MINISSNGPLFYLYSVKIHKCSGSCNNMNGPYAHLRFPNVFKNINVKVFNLISRTNKTRHTKQHGTCKCKCRLDASVYNNRKRGNNHKCRCKCKELIYKVIRDKVFIWNPCSCECKCDNSCDVGEYLDYENCNCRKKLAIKMYTNLVQYTLHYLSLLLQHSLALAVYFFIFIGT